MIDLKNNAFLFDEKRHHFTDYGLTVIGADKKQNSFSAFSGERVETNLGNGTMVKKYHRDVPFGIRIGVLLDDGWFHRFFE